MPTASDASTTLSLPAAWYPLCRSTDVRAGTVQGVDLGGVRYAVWRQADGRAAAVSATCAHVGADLSRGAVVGGTLQCPLHHWRYGADGRCVHIPAQAEIPPRARQSALEVCEAYGVVFGWLGGTPRYDLPRFVWEAAPVWSRAAVVDVAAPYTTLVANSYDGQHFATVHGRDLIEPPMLARNGPAHIAIQYQARVVGQRANDRLLRAIGIDRTHVTIHCWGGSVLHVYNQRTANTILVALLPASATTSRVFIVTVMAQGAQGVGRLRQQVYLAAARQMTVAFLRPDLQALEGVTLRPRLLLPGVDDALTAWLRYWRALPRAELDPRARAQPPASETWKDGAGDGEDT